MRTLSSRPARYSPQAVSPPRDRPPLDCVSEPLVATLATRVVPTYTLSADPSYVAATKDQAPVGRAVVPLAAAFTPPRYAVGTPLSSSSPYGKPPPGRSFAISVCEAANVVG